MRYLISFDSWYRVLSKVVGLPPSSSYVDVDAEQIEVRMGWAFRSRFARSAVSSVSEPGVRPLSRGVHGFAGRWLVNGAERGIVSMELTPPQRAYVIGFPVKLKQLMVSVASPTAFAESLGHRLQVRRE